VCVKPNENEVAEGVETDFWVNPEHVYRDKSNELARITGRHVFCTRAAAGIYLAMPWLLSGDTGMGGGTTVRSYPVSGPIDVVGAGDSCSAGITCAMVSGATHEQAAAFGNLVASITIR